MKLLLLDNYDSFVYNLAQALGALGAHVTVVRNDAWTLAQVQQFAPAAVVISPGPGSPSDPRYFGVCSQVIATLGSTLPMLGVCLGHQGMAHVLGGRIISAKQVMHGKSSAIHHDGSELFAGVPQGFAGMRYHSLVVDPEQLPACLDVTARTHDETIMAFAHRSAPMYGVQFHPESIGTPFGRTVLANFLRVARSRNPGG